jgi:dTDP-4-dehydrorhamnose reductase
MSHPLSNNNILIFGASGFIGNTIYKELLPYFNVFGTYCNAKGFEDNQVFFKFDVEKDHSYELLNAVQPGVIISCLRGDFKAQYKAHEELVSYVVTHDCKLLFLSSDSVFDGKFEFPSYENEPVKAESDYGRFKVSVEKMLQEIPAEKYIIARLPIVLGVNAPRIEQLKQAAMHKATFEVYPNLIISVTLADKIAQQIHYIINKSLEGIFHLASEDVVHHADIFREIASKLGDKLPIFKNVYGRNDDHYVAILPKENRLPKTYRISVEEVIEACTLKDEIFTLKN